MKWLKKQSGRSGSYRDPDLSDRWLNEAEWRAVNDFTKRYKVVDSRKTILRLVKEVRRLNKMLGR